MRHHDPRWIQILTSDYKSIALDRVEVQTMNGNPAVGFQWFGVKPAPRSSQIMRKSFQQAGSL